MFKYRCTACNRVWRSTAACAFCAFCPFTFRKPEALPWTPPSFMESKRHTCGGCSATVQVGGMSNITVCPTCAAPQENSAGDEAEDAEERALQEGLEGDRMRLLDGIRGIVQCGSQSHVLCLGASKHLAMVYTATQAGQYTLVSLDANDVGERVRVLNIYHPHLRVSSRSGIGSYTDRITLEGGAHPIDVRLLCLGYDAFFEKNPEKRYDVLMDKASWIFSASNSAGRYLASLKPGGYWITDNFIDYGQAPWLLQILGLTNETGRLNALAAIGYGYDRAYIYRRSTDRPRELLIYVMAYCHSIRLVLRSLQAHLRYGPDEMRRLRADALAIVQMKPMLEQAGLGGLYVQAMHFWDTALPTLEDEDEEEDEVVVVPPAEQTVQGLHMLNRFKDVSLPKLSQLAENDVLVDKLTPPSSFRIVRIDKPSVAAVSWMFTIRRV